MGNGRVYFADVGNNGTVEVLQESHNYPFGMQMQGISANSSPNNLYQYNGKELNADLGLYWIDYGARWQDPQLGRWWSVDPLAEKYAAISPFVYVANNPVIFIDPDGRNIEATGSTGELLKLISHTFNDKIEGRITDGNLTLHKAGASDDDTGIDINSSSDQEFISSLDEGQQVLFGVLDNAIQDEGTTTLNIHKKSSEVVIGQYGKDVQQIDVSDMLTLEKKSGGIISAGGLLAHEVEEGYQQQVKDVAYDKNFSYNSESGKYGGHRMGLEKQGEVDGYEIVVSRYDKRTGTSEYGIKRNGKNQKINFGVKKGKIKSFNISNF